MTPTPQQLSFYATANDSTESVALDAVAGSGKSYSLQQWATSHRGSGIATSFSRSTVQELGKKMPSKFPSRSLHGIGKDAITASGKFTAIENDKLYNYVKTRVTDDDESWKLISPILSLVEQAQTAGIVPQSERFFLPDTPENWESIADFYDIECNDYIYSVAHAALIESTRLARVEGKISFNDMLYIPIFYPHRFPRYKTVIVDERQDLNGLQLEIVSRILLPGGRVIAAGDERQAIYGFRGALHDACSTMNTKFSMTQMPLTVSFRCPRAVVLEAQQYVPHIEASPDAIEGDVVWHESLDLAEIPKTVLCRNNAPLITLALKLIAHGRSAEVAGRDIGKGLVSLSKKITKKNLSSPDFMERVHRWAEREIARKPKIKPRIEDKVSTFAALASASPDLAHIQANLERLYVNPEDKSRRPAEIYLSTIHRSKGREWPDVLFLDPQLLPSKYAKEEWEQKQEANLSYVGITRAQQTLHYCTSEDIQ